ncbi:hypothetical protein [Capnocytophaga gingivalis]|uniref:hypothetical protein n=1 Tax=Capnocytophaga gingivalis TaxID=1017 RepID=UPI0028E56A3D|nr:hypothetical protein [Capnocytophaga gingivalis]
MNFFIDIIIPLIVGIVGSWIAKPLLKYLINQNRKISSFIYTKLSYRNYNYGININIALIAMMLLFGIFIPKQVKLENQNEKYKTELSIYREGEKPKVELYTEAGKIAELDRNIKLIDYLNIIFKGVIYFIMSFFGVRIALSEIINKEVSEFDRDLKMLKPTISKEEYEQLEFLWAKMKNVEDFRNIRGKIKTLKENMPS